MLTRVSRWLGVSFLLLLLSVFATTTTTTRKPAVNGTVVVQTIKTTTTPKTTTTATTISSTRDGREYRVHPPDSNNTTQLQSELTQPPKGIGKGSWKAIDIWSADRTTIKRASSAEKVVSSSSTFQLMGFINLYLPFVLAAAHFVIAFA